MGKQKYTYSSSGVDLSAIHTIQNRINSMLKGTANAYTQEMVIGHYAGIFESGGQRFAMHCDGVGSKILVAAAMGKHDTIGIDAVAMNVNDLICIGAKPIVGVDYIALSRPDDELVEQVMIGITEGCRQSGMALIGGETAILPDMIKGAEITAKSAKNHFADYDLAITAVGIVEGELITGEKMVPGDVLIGLASSGIHSNGYSLARQLLNTKRWGQEMLAPTRIYVNPVLEMICTGHVHGIAHITGGAFSKLARIGKHGQVGFVLDKMPKPSGVFAEIMRKMKNDREAYRTFNMGIGMVIAAPAGVASVIMAIAKKHDVPSQIIGYVSEKQDVILQKDGKKISLL